MPIESKQFLYPIQEVVEDDSMRKPTALSIQVIILGGIVAVTPVAALAHPSSASHSGFLDGFLHPFTGIDHIIAMLGIGILAAFVKRAQGVRIAACTFLAFVAGGYVGIAGVGFNLAEPAALFSVIGVSLLLLLRHRVNLTALYLLTSGFGFTHGMVHGLEMPGQADLGLYFIGFVSASVVIAGSGALFTNLWKRQLSLQSR